MLKELLLFTYWLVRHPDFWFIPIPTLSVRLPLVTYPSLCSNCVTYRTQCHSIGHQVLPIQPLPREAEEFTRGGKHSYHVPLLTYLAWLQPISNDSKLIFNHVKIKDALLMVKSLTKNSGHTYQQSWISIHFNQLPKVIASSKNSFQNCSFKETHFNIAHSKKTYFEIAHSKMYFKLLSKKYLFISASINAVKSKTSINKSLIMMVLF